MKFTTTENTTYRFGIGKIPKPWIESCKDCTDIYKDTIVEYYYDNIRHWDFDFAGYETHDFVFEDGKAFRLEYSWWRDDYAEEDESCLKDEYYITEINIEEADVPEKKMGRDWI